MSRSCIFSNRGKPMAIAFFAAVATFLFDVATPQGYAPGMLYIVPVLASLWMQSPRCTEATAIVCTLLAIAGFFLSTPTGDLPEALTNRGLTVAIIWIVAALCLVIRKEKTQLREANEQLEVRHAELVAEIEHRKKVERHLLQSNGKLEQFAYAASHDMQEPLRAVVSFLGLLENRYREKLNTKGIEFIHHAVDGATRMQSLIHGLLDLARIQTKGRLFSLVDGDEVVRQALANLRLSIQESGAQITCDPLPVLWGDSVQLVQLFQNLIGNAIKYRGESRAIIHVGVKPGVGVREQILFIRDNGIGIDPKFAEEVFLLFRRLHTSGEYPGVGIGLALCKGIIDRHDGRIWVESQPGQGATFYIVIPERKSEAEVSFRKMAS